MVKALAKTVRKQPPLGEDLAFLKKRELSKEEGILLAIARLNGNDTLEQSDLQNPRARTLLADIKTPPKSSLPWFRKLIMTKAAERAVGRPVSKLMADLVEEAVNYTKYSSLADVTALTEFLARLESAPLSSPRIIKAKFRTLMFLSEFIALNNHLKMEGKKPLFTKEFADRMKEVVWLIQNDRIRLQIQPDITEKMEVMAFFSARVDKNGFANISIRSEDIHDHTIIHEAIHAAQQLKEGDRPTTANNEVEAHALSVRYAFIKYGPERSQQMLQPAPKKNNDNDGVRLRLVAELRKRLPGGIAERYVRFIELAAYTTKKVTKETDKYPLPNEAALNYAKAEEFDPTKAGKALRALRQSVIAAHGLNYLDIALSWISAYSGTSHFLQGSSHDFREVYRSSVNESLNLEQGLIGCVNFFSFPLADAIQAAVEENNMQKATTIIDKNILPKIWEYPAKRQPYRADWSELRKDYPFASAKRKSVK